jgi:hypothetical protein
MRVQKMIDDNVEKKTDAKKAKAIEIVDETKGLQANRGDFKADDKIFSKPA